MYIYIYIYIYTYICIYTLKRVRDDHERHLFSIVLSMTVSTENFTPPEIHQIQKLRFLGTNSN